MVRGLELPWHLARRIELTRSRGSRRLLVSQLRQHPLYAYWCSHVLFRYEVGMLVEASGLHASVARRQQEDAPAARLSVECALAWNAGPRSGSHGRIDYAILGVWGLRWGPWRLPQICDRAGRPGATTIQTRRTTAAAAVSDELSGGWRDPRTDRYPSPATWYVPLRRREK